MQVLIDIPEEDANFLMQSSFIPVGYFDLIHKALHDGIILPEHGDLIDRDKIEKDYDLVNATKYGNKNAKQQQHSYDTMMMYEIAYMLDDAEVVIPATKG